MKVCKKCNIEKNIDDFNQNKTSQDGYRGECKSCRKIYLQNNKVNIKERDKLYKEKNKETLKVKRKKYLEENKDKISKYLEENKDKIKEKRRIYYEKEKEYILESCKRYREENKDKIKEYYEKVEIKDHRKKLQKEYREENKEKLSHQKKKYYIENKDYIKKYKRLNKEQTNNSQRKRFEKNPILKIERVIRSSILNSIKRTGYTKKSKTYEILGCSFKDLKIYLESKFEPWMTWENRGLYNGDLNYGWDIDHIIPISSINTEEGIIRLNHYTNLQPLCSKVNRDIKKDRLDFI